MKTTICGLLLFFYVFSSGVYAQQRSCVRNKIRVACVGNSITYGSGIKDKTVDSYPAQLSFMLGEKYDVRNFGVGGANMLRKGKRPYWNCDEYKSVLEFQPDWVFIELGTNDSRTIDQIYLDEFVPNYNAMIQSFRELPSSPKVVLLLPVPVFGKETESVSDSVITKRIQPMIRRVAYDIRCETLNLYNLLIESPELFNSDLVHPTKAGATVIAQRVYEHVKRISDTGFQLSGVIHPDAKPFNHFGFQGYEFKFRDRTTRIVLPRETAPYHSWIFRTAHWYGEPQTDIALLEKGFHFVHCDVAELFGNDEAISIWNDLYLQLQKAGLAQKPVMEGMSRGGIYVYRWAARYPERVAAVYVDAPVLDLKSWPGGGGKRPRVENIWETFKKDFGLKNDEEAMAFKGNPVDLIDEIVAGGYPMLHVVGDKDIAVPVDENTTPFEQKIKAAGGIITVIHKKETGHHPHSLANPKPIVDFLLKATGYWETQQIRN
jgi:lysophospholipase L1-like esterase